MAGFTNNVQLLIPWANNATSTNVTSPMPVPSQSAGRASYTDGFPPLTFTPINAGGQGPDGRDMNGILKDLSTQLVAMSGGQYYPFSAAWATQWIGYKIGAIVAMADGTGQWINTVTGNTNNPDTAPAATSGWIPLTVSKVYVVNELGGTVVLNAVQASSRLIIISGNSNVVIQLPPWGMVFNILNKTTGGATVTLESTAPGSSFTIPPGGLTIVAVDTGGNTYAILTQPGFNT